MQENLDVLISFVIVVIGLSMLVQIVVEAIKNLLKLRWNVYERFIKDIYNRDFFDRPQALDDPESAPGPGEGKIEKQIRKIKEREKIGSVTQRFRNLHRRVAALAGDLSDLKQTLARVRKNLDNQTYQFDPQSLRALLHDLGLLRIRLKGKKFERLFRIYLRGVDEHTVATFNNVLDALDGLAGTDVRGIVAENVCATIDELFDKLQQLEGFVVEYRDKIADNIDSWLTDLEQRYANSIAKVSFVIGCLLVVGLNADAVTIYRNLRDTPAIRQNLIDRAESFTRFVQPPVSAEDLDRLSTLAEKIKSALDGDPAAVQIPADTFRTFADLYRSGASSLDREAAAANQVYRDIGGAERIGIRLPYDRRSMLRAPFDRTRALIDQKGDPLAADIPAVKQEIDRAVERLTANTIAFQYRAIRSRNAMIQAVGLPLGWSRDRLAAAFDHPLSLFLKLVGLLTTAVLISFGAPFWNDVLKALFGIQSLLRKRHAAGTGAG